MSTIDEIEKSVDLTKEYVRTTYYIEQVRSETTYIESVKKDKTKTQEQKLDILAQHILYFASCYVHGANLCAVLYENEQLKKQLK